MSIRRSILALLAGRPMHGAQLKAEFEARTGGFWALNVGQVYSTLARLQRDELAEVAEGPAASDGRITYQLTTQGEMEAAGWWRHPVERETIPRSELAVKLALAVNLAKPDVARVVQVQQAATRRHHRHLTQIRRQRMREQSDDVDLARSLVLEYLILTAEAELDWLAYVDAQLVHS